MTTPIERLTRSTELKWALVYTAMTIAWALVGKLAGFDDARIEFNQPFNTAILIPSFIVYWLALRAKKQRDYRGIMTYRQGLLTGLVMTGLITILGPLYPVISTQVISPGLLDRSIAFAVSSGAMSPADAQQQFTLTTFVIQGVIGALVFGVILSLVTALFARGAKTEPAGTVPHPESQA